MDNSGMFYSFVDYLEKINGRLDKYKNQPVILHAGERGTFTVLDVEVDLINRAVIIKSTEAKYDGKEVMTLTGLLSKLRQVKEDCFDYLPIIVKYESIMYTGNSIPQDSIAILKVAVGLTKDESTYAFIIE